MAVNFLMGFYTEAPYGPFAQTREGQEMLKSTIGIVQKINRLFDNYKIPRTYFLLGMFLEACERSLGTTAIKQIFDSSNPLIDLQQHGYSHHPFRKIISRPDKSHLTPNQVYEELMKTNQILERMFGQRSIGIGSPLGYTKGLDRDEEVIARIKEARMLYISSDLRDRDEGISPPLIEEGCLRQPRAYENGLVEIPSHGWQDMAFIGSKSEVVSDFRNWNKRQLDEFIVSHYCGILDEAEQKSLELEKDISIGGCFHPQAIFVYDQNLDLFKRIIDFALERNIRIASYTEIAKEFRESVVNHN